MTKLYKMYLGKVVEAERGLFYLGKPISRRIIGDFHLGKPKVNGRTR